MADLADLQAGRRRSGYCGHHSWRRKIQPVVQKLVYEKQIAQDVAVNQQSLILGSVFEVQVTAKAGVKPEDLEKAINAEMDAFRKEGRTAAEITRARNEIESRIIARLETLGGAGRV